jgi:hypothetical protein
VRHVASPVEEDIIADKVGAATRQHDATTAAADPINLRWRRIYNGGGRIGAAGRKIKAAEE